MIVSDTDALIPSALKGMDDFNIETCGLLISLLLHGVLLFLVTGELLIFQFLGKNNKGVT